MSETMISPKTGARVNGPKVTDDPPKDSASPRRASAVVARIVDLGILLALLVLIVVGLFFVPEFGSTGNLKAVLYEAAFLGIVAIGMTFVVVSGNILDLSVVAQIGAAAVVVAILQPMGLPVAILGAVLTCLAFAAINTLGVGVMKANGVVVTLAVQTAGLGLLLYLTAGGQYQVSSPALNQIATSAIGPLPWVFIGMVAIAFIAEFVLQKTNMGLSVRSVGTKSSAARVAGIGVGRSVFASFAVVSLVCATTGILLAGFNNNAMATMGTGYDFNALAAVIIGGTSLFGGRGSVLRTLVGVLFVGVLLNISVLLGLPFEWQQFVKGLIIVLAVAGDVLLRRKGIR